MLHHVVKADPDDLPAILAIAHDSFLKFELYKQHNWDQDYISTLLQGFLKQDDMHIYVAKKLLDKAIVGFFIVHYSPGLYNKQGRTIDLGLQPSPRLPQFYQAKVLLSLIKKIEAVSAELNAVFNGISVMPIFDISHLLKKRGYFLSDMIYVKKL